MISLKAANPNNQSKLDREIELFRKVFLKLESDQEGERANAATQMMNIIGRINELTGKDEGHPDRFSLSNVLDGNMESAQGLQERLTELQYQLESAKAAEQAALDKLEKLVFDREWESRGKEASQARVRARPVKDSVTGALGVSLLTAVAAAVVFEIPWINVFLVLTCVLVVFPFGIKHAGSFLLNAGDELQYRLALCAGGVIAGVKGLGFSFALLLLAGFVAQAGGAASFLGSDVPDDPSLEGMFTWSSAAMADISGMFFLLAGIAVYFVIRRYVRRRNLPGVLETLFS